MNGIEKNAATRKWIIVHGHFYQPPRENPWLDVIENQESAHPFHDWNERIYSQCYRPNGYSRLLDHHGMITGISNNYEQMSFNFGPTLLSWLKQYHPVSFGRIIEGDRIGASRHNGHGNAIAQVYNHIIMPLASRRDKLTQIRWAKSSFRNSFGREPEGMWLAETAINMETAQCLIDENISFVVLSPNQAEAFRPLHGHAGWISASNGLDTRRPYRLFATDSSGSKTGGHLDVFFFDEGLSKEVSFNGVLQNANVLGERIDRCYSPDSPVDEVVVVATDGETFGHHKPFGDMCLAYFFKHVAPARGITPVNFGRFRALHPPQYEVTLKDMFGEGTSWSCAHGVGRWTRDCGCSTGGKDTWKQAWRGPLRRALENLQKKVDAVFVKMCSSGGIDPWQLRDWYCDKYRPADFVAWKTALHRHFPEAKLTDEALSELRRLLEAQRYMLYAFTSCGWFFAELSGIEPMQNLAYACRALQLGLSGSGQQAELEAFLSDLAHAPSNIGNENGATLFTRQVLPYFYHNHIMAFVVAMEKFFGVIPGTTIKKYGYDCTVSVSNKNGTMTSGQTAYIYDVTINHKRYSKHDTFIVMIDCAAESVPEGWVMLYDGHKKKEPSVSAELFKADRAVKHFSLATIFSSLREEIADVYLEKIAAEARKQFSAWFKNNEKDLSLLEICYPPIPEYFRTPIGFVLQQQWNTVFEKMDLTSSVAENYDQLAEIHGKIKQHSVEIDLKYSAGLCEKELTEALEKIKQKLTADQCENICMLMDVVDKYKLPVAKHRLEDIFHPVLSGPVHDLYLEVIGTAVKKKAGPESDLLTKILKFAHRMNFNTDQYPLL